MERRLDPLDQPVWNSPDVALPLALLEDPSRLEADNPELKASGRSELAEFGIALMPDRPPGTRPADGERICADLLLDRHGRTLRTWVTYFDERRLRAIMTEAGFRDIAIQPSSKWKLPEALSEDVRERFARYVACNPEMVSFTAIAGDVA